MAARHLKGVHATIIDSSTINDIIGGSQRGSDGLQSILDNIALAIYKEPLLQAAKASSDKYLATPWTLCQPADGKGETLYLGIDVGHSEGPKVNPAICTAIYNAYSSMLGASMFSSTKGKKLSSDDLQEAIEDAYALVEQLDPPLKTRPTRIVVFRDGIPYGNELVDSQLKLGDHTAKVIVVGVAKKHNTRIYIEAEHDGYMKAFNPPSLTAYYLGAYWHPERGYRAHHVTTSIKP